jgi:hypothetical protein
MNQLVGKNFWLKNFFRGSYQTSAKKKTKQNKKRPENEKC